MPIHRLLRLLTLMGGTLAIAPNDKSTEQITPCRAHPKRASYGNSTTPGTHIGFMPAGNGQITHGRVRNSVACTDHMSGLFEVEHAHMTRTRRQSKV